MSDQTHELFKQNLKDSKRGVLRLADVLTDRGFWVTLPPVSVAEERKDYRKHVDSGDLFVKKEGDDDFERWEVKSRTLDFTSEKDFPYRDGIFVSACNAYDEAEPKPKWIVSLNHDMTHAAFVKGDSWLYWTDQLVYDKRYDEQRNVYLCPLEHVHWKKL